MVLPSTASSATGELTTQKVNIQIYAETQMTLMSSKPWMLIYMKHYTSGITLPAFRIKILFWN